MVNAERTRDVARATARLLEAVNNSDTSGVLRVWAIDGVLMPPHHPMMVGSEAIEAYFRNLFSRVKLQFTFTSSEIVIAGSVAIERVTYTAMIWPADGGPPLADRGKGVHICRRQPDGSWRISQDIWNSDRPLAEGSPGSAE